MEKEQRADAVERVQKSGASTDSRLRGHCGQQINVGGAYDRAIRMSAPNFPSLLRRSAFASYDPLITRVYTSAQPATPSSSSTVSPRSSEYGLKYPIHSKRARYIKVKSLDAGPGLGCDWQSGEKEARFVQQWGDGRVRWHGQNGERASPSLALRREGLSSSGPSVQPEPRERELIPDVEGMSPKRFQRYLDTLRSQRTPFTEIIKMQVENRVGKDAESGQKNIAQSDSAFTLLRHSRSRYAEPGEVSRYQAILTSVDLASPSSRQISSRPHPAHGLAYSTPPTSVGSVPGRVFNQETRVAQRNRQTDNWGGQSFRGTNANWVVGLGGLTGSMENQPGMGDISLDFSRQDKTVGTGEFNVKHAEAKRAPTVVGLGRKTINPRNMADSRPVSAAKSVSPLDSFAFKLSVEPAASAGTEPALGSPEWVAKERKAPGPVGGMLSRAGASVELGRAASGWQRVQKATQQRTMDVAAMLQSLGAKKSE